MPENWLFLSFALEPTFLNECFCCGQVQSRTRPVGVGGANDDGPGGRGRRCHQPIALRHWGIQRNGETLVGRVLPPRTQRMDQTKVKALTNLFSIKVTC